MRKFLILGLFIFSYQGFAQAIENNATVVETYNCGTDCQATLYSDGVFKVRGTGENGAGTMGNYSYTEDETGNRPTTADWADHLSDIKKVVIEDGITNVGGFTFNGATNLKSLEIPESVKTIGTWAFLFTSLETVNTLKNVTDIGPAAFYFSKLQNADLSEDLTVIKQDVFTGTNLTNITIPDGVTSIGNWAFSNCPYLNEINLPDKVDQIGREAFESNTKIYCQDTKAHQCDELINNVTGGQVIKYTTEGNRYVLDGQKYRTLADMQNNIPVKRIYTVEEAEKVSKPTGNKIMLRYK